MNAHPVVRGKRADACAKFSPVVQRLRHAPLHTNTSLQRLLSCTKLGWIGVYTFAKFASALVNFSYKFVDGNTTFNDRPLTDLKIKCVQP